MCIFPYKSVYVSVEIILTNRSTIFLYEIEGWSKNSELSVANVIP